MYVQAQLGYGIVIDKMARASDTSHKVPVIILQRPSFRVDITQQVDRIEELGESSRSPCERLGRASGYSIKGYRPAEY